MQRRITERILLVASAAFLFASIFGWFGSTLPEYYESKTVLVIKPPQISGKVVRNLTEEEFARKFQPINEEIFNEKSLERMIVKYHLFESERVKGMELEIVREILEKKSWILTEKSEAGIVKGFTIAFTDKSPENARNVVAVLAENYVNAVNSKKWEEKLDGETVSVIEPANLPQSPISPTWFDFTLIGAGFGFFVGLILLGLSRLANILRIRFAELDLQ